MGIDLLNIEPYKVVKSLKGHHFFFYGEGKVGKTTVASKFPKSLLLAFEAGYTCLPGVLKYDVPSWGTFKMIANELKKPEVKERYDFIIIDTVDIANELCNKYICDNNNVEELSGIPYGNGYGLRDKEFKRVINGIEKLGYGIIFIGHEVTKTLKPEGEDEYQKIVPSADKRVVKFLNEFVDIAGYIKQEPIPNTDRMTTKLYSRGTMKFWAGTRFAYIDPVIDFSYENVEKAVFTAIEREEKIVGKKMFTQKTQGKAENVDYDFNALKDEFNHVVMEIKNKVEEDEFVAQWQPVITEVIEKYLGIGKKIKDTTKRQAEAIYLIVEELKQLQV